MSQLKKKKQRTTWIFETHYANNGLIRVGFVFNCRIPTDVVRLQIWRNEKECLFDLTFRYDEAICIVSGLNDVLARMAIGNLPGLTAFCKNRFKVKK